MAESSDTFLSDVHIGTFGSLSEKGTIVSRFPFRLRDRTCMRATYTEVKGHPELDEDGDLIVERKYPAKHHVLLMEHAMSTPLKDVGQQVWRGALLMADYLLHNHASFQESVVVELGAGVGLVSIVAALSAKHVFCTDVGERLLDLCQRNAEQNLAEFDRHGSVYVKELDWTKPFRSSSSTYSWRTEDMKILENTTFVLATDVVYEDTLTDAFFFCLMRLHMKFVDKRSPAILIALEKRVNFSLEDLAPVSPAYGHFRQCLERQYSSGDSEVRFSVRQLSTEFPQYLQYERVKELELWEMKLTRVS